METPVTDAAIRAQELNRVQPGDIVTLPYVRYVRDPIQLEVRVSR